jgi:hypothetical protein
LRLARSDLKQAFSIVVEQSPELAALFEDLDRTWGHLRGLRKAFMEIAHRGFFSPRFARWDVSVPLDPDVRPSMDSSYPFDPEPAARWAAALDKLLQDPNAPLPGDNK